MSHDAPGPGHPQAHVLPHCFQLSDGRPPPPCHLRESSAPSRPERDRPLQLEPSQSATPAVPPPPPNPVGPRPSREAPQKGAGGNGPEPITDLGSTGGRGSDHPPAAPLSEETSPGHLKTPSRPDWLVGSPTEPPRATRPLLVVSARQSERNSPLIGRRPLRPAAEAGATASRRKGSGERAGERPRGCGGGGRTGGRVEGAGVRGRGSHRYAALRES